MAAVSETRASATNPSWLCWHHGDRNPLEPSERCGFHAGFETMMTIMRFATAAFAIAISVLFAWIIKRLVSRAVKAEFDAL